MPSLTVSEEYLRQIIDSVGYKIKTKIDTLVNTSGTNTQNINYLTAQTQSFIGPTLTKIDANVRYLTEVTSINDSTASLTGVKALDFHKFLTTEHIPSSNLFDQTSNLQKSDDVYVTGLGAVGVKKNGLDVFEEYYNGNYPGTMFSTASCGKQLMGLTFGRMMAKGVGLHNVPADGYTSNMLTLDTPVANIIYGTDLSAYGQGVYSLPAGLENARMRDLLSMRAGFDEYDSLLWFIAIEYIASVTYSYSWLTEAYSPLSVGYVAFAGNVAFGPYAITIETFQDVLDKTNQYVNLRTFGQYIKNDYINNPITLNTAANGLLGLSFFAEATSSNIFGELFTSSGYSNTSVRYQRSAFPFYGQDKPEHYNNECFVFATKMMQIALMKEAVNGNRTVLTSPVLYSNVGVSLSSLSSNTFGAVPRTTCITNMRDNFRNFFNNEVLAQSGVPNTNTKLTVLQSDNYGTILPDLSHVAFPHLMGVADTFAKDLFLVRDTPAAVTSVYSNLFLSNITLYNFSSNIVPRLRPFDVDPFETPAVIKSGELLNSQKGFSMTNGIWTVTDILANNRQRSSNVYQMFGLYGQRMIMGRDSTAAKNRYTVGMMSDDALNNPQNLQGPEFVYDNRNTVRSTYTTTASIGSVDPTMSLIAAAYNDSVSIPYAAGGVKSLNGFRNRQEVDKSISYIRDMTPSSNTWGYDSVGLVLTNHQTADRAYYSNLTTSNALQVADISTGILLGYSNCLADVHYTEFDIFDQAKLTF